MFSVALSAILRFLSAGFKGIQGAVAYSFGTPERRKLSALAVIYTAGFLLIEWITVGSYWLPVALLDTAFVLVINAVQLWVEGQKPVTIAWGPSGTTKV